MSINTRFRRALGSIGMGLEDDRSSKRYDLHTKAPEMATVAASKSFVTVNQEGEQ
jgi:hypothetical protein